MYVVTLVQQLCYNAGIYTTHSEVATLLCNRNVTVNVMPRIWNM